MTIAFGLLTLLGGSLAFIAACGRAPEGYEDKDGFHTLQQTRGSIDPTAVVKRRSVTFFARKAA